MITMDNADIEEITIDGEEVVEVTIDGLVCWAKTVAGNLGYRNILVGDNLNEKNLAFDFPREIGNNFSTGTQNFVTSETSTHIKTTSSGGGTQVLVNNYSAYNYNTIYDMLMYNNEEYVIPQEENWGNVTSIDTNNPAYTHVKVGVPIKDIQLGEDLSGKRLFLTFPDNLYQELGTQQGFIIMGSNGNIGVWMSGQFNETKNVVVNFNAGTLYSSYEQTTNTNIKTFVLPLDFGSVMDIDYSLAALQYIKVEV